MNKKIAKETKDHPERFDFQDVPDAKLSKEYKADMSFQPGNGRSFQS